MALTNTDKTEIERIAGYEVKKRPQTIRASFENTPQ